MPLFVSIAGNIGAGKTTACNLIAEAFGFRPLYEPVVDNRFLAPYYADMRRWSFTLQMEFLLKRVEHHRLVDAHSVGCIQDRTLLEDPEIFAKYLHGLGNMTDEELDLYFDYVRMVLPQIRQPDRIIFLSCPDVNILLRRISERGRAAEASIEAQFLRGLAHYYAVFPQVCESKYGIPTLSVDVSRLDIRSEAGRADMLAQVEDFLLEDGGTGRLF